MNAISTVLITGIFSIIAAGISAYITSIFQERSKLKILEFERKQKNIEIKKVERSFREPVRVPDGEFRNSIVLIGLGGTGKTTFIKALLQNEEANPDEKTEKYEIYHGDRSSGKVANSKKNKKTWFYIADYKGQNIGQLVRAFILQQKKKYSPVAYSYINSFILMVDLWPPSDRQNDPDPSPQDKPNMERVDTHNEQWNDTSLDALFGIFTNSLSYVCLFINKIDLMSDQSEEAKHSYISMYKELAKRIQKRCSPINVDIILGSAKEGTGITKVTSKLIENSVPNTDEKEVKICQSGENL